MQKIAVLFGATGLVGGALLELLLKDPEYDLVRVVGRRPVGRSHPRLEEHVIEMSDLGAMRKAITGAAAIFVAIGTTMRKVKGNRDLYRSIDFDIPVHAAKLASEAGVHAFALVSAVGADANNAYNFYIKLKGVTEETVAEQGVPVTVILRPSLLMGNRLERRPAERLSQWIFPLVEPLLSGRLRKYHSIQAQDVAKAMLHYVRTAAPGVQVLEYDQMMENASAFSA